AHSWKIPEHTRTLAWIDLRCRLCRRCKSTTAVSRTRLIHEAKEQTMSTDVMTEPIIQRSPRSLARIAGVFDFLEGLASGFGQIIVPGMLVVAGDAAATAAYVLAHGSMFRVTIIASMILHVW